MNQLKAQDRLQPALLDRLTDNDPTNTQEAMEMRIISRPRMREAVLRDLSWLFNTTFMDAEADYADYPEVRRSVINYGLPALSGHTASSIDPAALEANVKTAILNYEPRIVAETLHVEAVVLGKQMDHHNQISFRISGQLWAQPVPLEMLLHTDIDLETGRVGIKDLTR